MKVCGNETKGFFQMEIPSSAHFILIVGTSALSCLACQALLRSRDRLTLLRETHTPVSLSDPIFPAIFTSPSSARPVLRLRCRLSFSCHPGFTDKSLLLFFVPLWRKKNCKKNQKVINCFTLVLSFPVYFYFFILNNFYTF